MSIASAGYRSVPEMPDGVEGRGVALSRYVLFVGNNAAYFVMHRLALARMLREAGYRVGAVLPKPVAQGERAAMAAAGIEVLTYPYWATGVNPLVEWRSVLALTRLYRRERPDIVHHLTLKPVLYGGIAARRAGIGARIHSIMGLGYLFHSDDRLPRLLRSALRPVFRYALGGRGSVVTVENPDDLARLRAEGCLPELPASDIRVLPGSGIDPDAYDPDTPEATPPIVMCAGRLLRSKGIAEFADAARIVRGSRPDVRFVLCGGLAEQNPAAVDRADLDRWVAEGAIEWWGHRDDLAAIVQQSAIVALPTYNEGLPRVLLEGAAAARPLVATDIAGCRRIVHNGTNGILVPVRDAPALAAAMLALLANPKQRRAMGLAGRALVKREFAIAIVAAETLAIYASSVRR